jgi:hypothetical protein
MNDNDRLEIARIYQNLNQTVTSAFKNKSNAIICSQRDKTFSFELHAYKGRCLLLDAWGFNKNTDTEYYIQLFDTDSTPPDNSIPLYVTKVLANATGSIPTWFFDRDIKPRLFERGIYLCVSSTPEKKTITAATDVDFHVHFLPDAPQQIQ